MIKNERPRVHFGDLENPAGTIMLIANRVLAALDDAGPRESGNLFFQQALVAPDFEAFVAVVLTFVEDADGSLS
jgi:hypothetical protein